MMKYLSEAGCTVVQDPAGADIVFVNTCGFITEAKEESIRTIFEMLELKKQGVRAVFATGCFAKRYAKELRSQVPELDGILGYMITPIYPEMLNYFEKGASISAPRALRNIWTPRREGLFPPRHTAHILK